MKKFARTTVLLRIAILVLLCFLCACDGAEEALEGDFSANQPPRTEIVGTPPTLSRTDFEVEFHWQGDDHDGEVVGFEWRISNNGPDGIVSVMDTLEALLPWNYTTATDTIFQVIADLDSFPADLGDPDRDPRHIRFWQSHTLYVRAIDDEGARDPTPASSSFTATTLAPTAQILVPKLIPSVTCVNSARVLTFGWKATDPDGFRQIPEATRHILLPVVQEDNACYTQVSFEAAEVISPADTLWSEWIQYDPNDESTHTVTYPRTDVGLAYLFAVQARDDAGATTPTFEWNRNVRHVQTTSFQLPQLRVSEPRLGSYSFVGTTGSRSFDVVSNQKLELTWIADASAYAGTIEAYRYGWDVADPEDSQDPGWATNWGLSPSHVYSPTRQFDRGSHRLIIRARDNSGTEAQASLIFNVIPIPSRDEQRPLLIVDDFPNGNTLEEIALDREWDRTLRALVEGSLIGYSGGDFIDADDPRQRLNFRTLIEYRAVMWFFGPSNQSFWYRQFTQGGSALHFVDIYQQTVGNLLLVGPGTVYSTTSHSGWFVSYPQQFQRNFNLYPVRSLCLELNDLVRPAPGTVLGEQPGSPARTMQCDGMYSAAVHEQFLAEYPDAAGDLVDLRPTGPRIVLDRSWDLDLEEFYNTNVTNVRMNVILRDCQTPMFGLVSRRTAGIVDDPQQNCRPRNADRSPLDGVPVGLATRSYADEKPLRGSEDFVWGFHPAAFRFEDVQTALLYVLDRRWDMPVLR